MKQMFLQQEARYEHTQRKPEGETVYKYNVTKVIGDTKPKVGDILTEQQVSDYCEMTGVWKVTIS